MRRKIKIILVTLFFSPLITVASSEIGQTKTMYFKESFIEDTIFKVSASDLMEEGWDQLVFLARNYLNNWARLYVYDWSKDGPIEIWQSPNLLEEKSPIFMATGKPLPNKKSSIIIATNRRLEVYTYEDGNFVLASQIYHALYPQEITVSDINNDGIDEILLVRVGRTTTSYNDHLIEAYQIVDGELVLLGTSPLLGNIRAITSGELGPGNEGCQVVVESGLGNNSGVLYLLRWEEDALRIKNATEKLLPSIVYGLDIGSVNGLPVLVTAEVWGRVNYFGFQADTAGGGRFERLGDELSLKHAFLSAAIGGLKGLPETAVVLIGHPSVLLILTASL